MFNSLPGRVLSRSPKEYCESCEDDTPATVEIQGETDSFGYESIYLCDQHHKEMVEEMNNPEEDYCHVCKEIKPLFPFRSPDEVNGPVDEICQDCASRINSNFVRDMGGYDDDE